MPRKPDMTAEVYAKLVEAFRLKPGNISACARAVGVTPGAAGDAWRRGWRQLGLQPIRDLLFGEDRLAAAIAKEQAQKEVMEAKAEAEVARRLVSDAASKAALEATAADAAREAKQQAAARADNRDEAVVVLEEERKLRKGARAVAGTNLVASARWGKAHQLVAEELVKRVERERESMTVDQLSELARMMALVDRTRLGLLREASELERLHRGDPSVIVGVTPTEMSTDEAIKEIERANLALQRYRRRGLELIEGGAQVATGPVIDVTPTS